MRYVKSFCPVIARKVFGVQTLQDYFQPGHLSRGVVPEWYERSIWAGYRRVSAAVAEIKNPGSSAKNVKMWGFRTA